MTAVCYVAAFLPATVRFAGVLQERTSRILLQCVSKGLLLIRYVVEGFREKNKDALHPDLVSLLEGVMTSDLLRHSDIW